MKFTLQLSDNLLESSPEFVAQHGISRFSRNTKADSESLGAMFSPQDHQVAMACRLAFAKDSLKFAICLKSLHWALVGQFVTSSFAATRQHVASARGGHSFTKAVFFFSLTDFGLICPLHWFPPLKKLMTNIGIMRASCQAHETYSNYSQSFPHSKNHHFTGFIGFFGPIFDFFQDSQKKFENGDHLKLSIC